MGDEVAGMMKFIRRRLKDLTMTSGFWNFLMTLITITTLIFYFGGAPNTTNFRVREKVNIDVPASARASPATSPCPPQISVKKLMNAAIELSIMGGKEVVRVR